MSKNKKVEQIIRSDKVYSSSDKDNAGNKSTSSSSPLHPIEQQENQQHSTANAIEAEQWQQQQQPSSIVKNASQGSSPTPQQPPSGLAATGTPEHMRGAATKDMFDLIERVQCSRIDDQRCVLPAYFSQLPY
ncbi:uncharacterized protein LOC129921501 [Episyrphus balteatus]|uniref:uncharacterized protein LOC129921501 n=1 Tax=Episyrphus balteatus TaxID=286459 RepID=UPI0024868E3B|nr:uncharacterized protein LOC129921501 [Episyrphus balteatus]XP_055859329.1 uncharacterized protein LOC129921501 [Episyrphus balteatus]